jgi:uncharacterized protein YsxB (DUF464 family)
MKIGKSTGSVVCTHASSINHILINNIDQTLQKNVRLRREELTLIVFMLDNIRSVPNTRQAW